MASLACQRLGSSTLRQHHSHQGAEGGKPAMVHALPLLKVQDAFFRSSAFLGFPPHTGGGSAAAGSALPSSPKCSTNSLHILRNMANQAASPACTADQQEALIRLDMSDPTCDEFKQTFLMAMADESSTPPAAAASSTSTSLSASDSDEDEEASSSFSSSSSDVCNHGPLDSLSSLSEALLPLKRGLSRFFSGKSQSFSSIAEVCSVGELAKPENPFVKRRRTAAAGCSYSSFPPLPSGSTMNHKKSKRTSATKTAVTGIRTMTSTTKDNEPINVLSLKCFRASLCT